MAEHLTEAVAHAFIAALAVEAVLRLWRVRSPHLRVVSRLAVFAEPLVVLGAFELFAPFRHQAWFTDGPALFSTAHLGALSLLGVGLDRLLLWSAGALGLALLSRDLWPLFTTRRPWSRAWPHPTPPVAPELQTAAAKNHSNRLSEALQHLAAASGTGPPQVALLEERTPVLCAVGIRRPRLVVSTAVLELLDERELRGALAHELAHLRRHDIMLSWGLLLGRVAQPFNPVVQVVGRVVALDTEFRADADAAQLTRQPASLASALLKVFGAPGAPSESWLGARLPAARLAELERRCRALLATPEEPDAGRDDPGRWAFAFFALGLTALLFFVT